MRYLYLHNPPECPRCHRWFDTTDPDDFQCDCAVGAQDFDEDRAEAGRSVPQPTPAKQ